MSKAAYLCPIPWISLSLGAKTSPRLCCHQNGLTEAVGDMLNLDHTSSARQQMLNGTAPKECSTCVQLEDANCRSPREDYLDRFSFDPQTTNVIKYLDLTVDNECNLECVMCSPLYTRKLSPFYENILKTPAEKAWVINFDEIELDRILPHLEQVTLTGGEPFISVKARKIIHQLASSARAPEIILRVFTNLSHLPEDILADLNKFKKLEFILSIDSVEENYELMRFPAKWERLLQNLNKLKSYNFRNIDLHQHTVITAVNWEYIGSVIDFFALNLPDSYNILPIFVEVETPLILHPRVLPEEQWEQGKLSIARALKHLVPKNSAQEQQILNLYNLILKMENRNFSSKYFDYKVFMKSIMAQRTQRMGL